MELRSSVPSCQVPLLARPARRAARRPERQHGPGGSTAVLPARAWPRHGSAEAVGRPASRAGVAGHRHCWRAPLLHPAAAGILPCTPGKDAGCATARPRDASGHGGVPGMAQGGLTEGPKPAVAHQMQRVPAGGSWSSLGRSGAGPPPRTLAGAPASPRSAPPAPAAPAPGPCPARHRFRLVCTFSTDAGAGKHPRCQGPGRSEPSSCMLPSSSSPARWGCCKELSPEAHPSTPQPPHPRAPDPVN